MHGHTYWRTDISTSNDIRSTQRSQPNNDKEYQRQTSVCIHYMEFVNDDKAIDRSLRLTELRFYVPLDTKQVISEMLFLVNLLV